MTNQKMPDEISLFRCESEGDIKWSEDSSDALATYVKENLYTAACAERDALRALCEGMAKKIDQVLDWLGDEMFDDDVREKRHNDTTQEERAENISDMLRDMLAAYENHKGVG